MVTWLLPRADLTPDQLRVVEMPPTENKVIFGLPGSGKTQVLIHRASFLARQYNVPVERYRIFVFTNVIKSYIRSGLKILNLPDDAVTTFDHWCRLLYQKHISKTLPWNNSEKTYDFKQIRRSVLDLLRSCNTLRQALDFVIVDEGQDLTPEIYQILSLSSRHITVFIDPQQKIFEEGASEEFILRELGVARRNVSFIQALRNSPYVAQLASYFIDDLEIRKQYLKQIQSQQKIRERPLFFIASSFEEEIDNLANIIHQRQVMNERVGIIVGLNRQVHGIAKGLEERGVEVEKAIRQTTSRGGESFCDFDNMIPKIATYHMAKGLTFDTILLPRLSLKSFPNVSQKSRQKMIFVGIARATQWVYLSTVENMELEELDLLRRAEANGHLTIQNGKGDRRGPLRGSGGQDGDEFSVL